MSWREKSWPAHIRQESANDSPWCAPVGLQAKNRDDMWQGLDEEGNKDGERNEDNGEDKEGGEEDGHVTA